MKCDLMILAFAIASVHSVNAVGLSGRLADAHEAMMDRCAIGAASMESVLPRPHGVDVRDLGLARYRVLDPTYRWRDRITATVFWVGEEARPGNPVSNDKSSWDPYWQQTFGGFDAPDARNGYLPIGFYPDQSPFYVALPFNDIDPSTGLLREGADHYIPWYWEDYRGPGITVCDGRWVAIRYNGKVCYAQWRDVGPFRTDDVDYVFGQNRPLPNRNDDAGIDVSPAVRDFLAIKSGAKVDWRFVDDEEVAAGPWDAWRY
ncbi:hypothetical protein [Sulfuriroseicoccus oceanibius]|uniref:Uncharacterized protein n=1 Tax=Sulfuriroseicoccus oceanibius TaxID=2707525 RepID=A0A7T7F0P8_9BACT|nr:hypothetical protein [Sulfuriroseicoccus oceanibius]QQL44527.1 hypothetical protein G3M56_011640 [Sulfuriroseicoccus oceanibius]